MDVKRLSRQTCRFLQPPGVVSFAAVAGKLEGEGPLGGCFDAVGTDAFCGKKTWRMPCVWPCKRAGWRRRTWTAPSPGIC